MPLTEPEKDLLRHLTLTIFDNSLSETQKADVVDRITSLSPDLYYLDYVFYPEQDGALGWIIDRAIEKAALYRPIAL